MTPSCGMLPGDREKKCACVYVVLVSEMRAKRFHNAI